MTRLIRIILCSLLVIADMATGVVAYGTVWCQESDGRVSLETSEESDACHQRQQSGSHEDTLALAQPGCVDVPVVSPQLTASATRLDVEKLARVATALVVVVLQTPELSPSHRVPQPEPIFISRSLLAHSTIVLLV